VSRSRELSSKLNRQFPGRLIGDKAHRIDWLAGGPSGNVVSGRISAAAKISSDAESIELRLVPKPKLICRLRDLFASAYLIGWKFELEGTPTDAVQKGMEQIRVNRTDACVVNGSAFGPGFGFCTSQGLVRGLVRTFPTKDALSDWLVETVGVGRTFG
jgi:hypothetical protein